MFVCHVLTIRYTKLISPFIICCWPFTSLRKGFDIQISGKSQVESKWTKMFDMQQFLDSIHIFASLSSHLWYFILYYRYYSPQRFRPLKDISCGQWIRSSLRHARRIPDSSSHHLHQWWEVGRSDTVSLAAAARIRYVHRWQKKLLSTAVKKWNKLNVYLLVIKMHYALAVGATASPSSFLAFFLSGA